MTGNRRNEFSGGYMVKELVAIIVEVVQEFTEQQDITVSVSLDAATPLYGQDGILDSLGLVSLVVALEQAIEDTFGVSISLADDKAMSQRHSPYRTIGSLAAYASHLIQEEP
jgi:acyl carrier protein